MKLLGIKELHWAHCIVRNKCSNAFMFVLTGNIPEYSIVYPSIQRLTDTNKRDGSDDDADQYLIEGLPPINDHMMVVKLMHNNALKPRR